MDKDVKISTDATVNTTIITKIARATVTFATDSKPFAGIPFCFGVLYNKSITI